MAHDKLALSLNLGIFRTDDNKILQWKSSGQALLLTTFKTDLDGAIFACAYCARLAYVMIFDYPHAYSVHLQLFHNESYECGGSNLHDMICHEVKTVVSCVTLHTFCTNIT